MAQATPKFKFKPVDCPECAAVGVKRTFLRATGLGSHRRTHGIIGSSETVINMRKQLEKNQIEDQPAQSEEPEAMRAGATEEELDEQEEELSATPPDLQDNLFEEQEEDEDMLPAPTYGLPLHIRLFKFLQKNHGKATRTMIRQRFSHDPEGAVDLLHLWKNKGLGDILPPSGKGRPSEVWEFDLSSPEAFIPNGDAPKHEGQFPCPNCDRTFESSRGLARHNTEMHQKQMQKLTKGNQPTPKGAITTNGNGNGNGHTPQINPPTEQTFSFTAREVQLDRAAAFGAGFTEAHLGILAGTENVSSSELIQRSLQYLLARQSRK